MIFQKSVATNKVLCVCLGEKVEAIRLILISADGLVADPRFNTFFPVLILSIRTACQSEALFAFNIWDWVQSNSQLSESTQYVFNLVFFCGCLFVCSKSRGYLSDSNHF